MKWVCKVCGYIYEGSEPPAECPVCHAPASQFEEVKGELTLAAEHEYGIYDKTVKDNPDISDEDKAYILEQLKANFTGECTEVGMYLCMARIAHREGYPEIGLYWEKAAYEEAEHAAKFAELLGSELEPNMKATTKDNLAWRVDCEFGATAGKFELATCAKKNGLDAIHDTVHEMARDEARHGKALEGLLEALLRLMAGKPSKKKAAKKKVKPSGPARCAVLWGLDPSFGEGAAQKGAAVRQVLRQMGVPARMLAYERLGDSAAAAAGLVGARLAHAPYDGPAPDCEFVLLCGFNNPQVSEFIARSREAGCTVGPKALLTSANRSWPMARLIQAVNAEHHQMTG